MADKDTGDLKALNLAGTTLLELIKLQKQADGPISGASALTTEDFHAYLKRVRMYLKRLTPKLTRIGLGRSRSPLRCWKLASVE